MCAHQKKLHVCPSETAAQMISDPLNRAVSPAVNSNAAMTPVCNCVVYGPCGLVEAARLSVRLWMLRSQPDFGASHPPVSCSPSCCSQRWRLTLMCANNFIGNSVFSICCRRKFSVTDDKVSVGVNSVLANTSLSDVICSTTGATVHLLWMQETGRLDIGQVNCDE